MSRCLLRSSGFLRGPPAKPRGRNMPYHYGIGRIDDAAQVQERSRSKARAVPARDAAVNAVKGQSSRAGMPHQDRWVRRAVATRLCRTVGHALGSPVPTGAEAKSSRPRR